MSGHPEAYQARELPSHHSDKGNQRSPVTTTVMAVITEALLCPDLLFTNQSLSLVFW